jgi:hypothetical protein
MVNVAAFLQLTNHCATAMAARENAAEREVLFHFPRLFCPPAVQNQLHLLPKLA